MPLLGAGVRGFKCFLCPSGVDEFPMVSQQDLEKAYIQLQSTSATILVQFQSMHIYPCSPSQHYYFG